MSVHTDRMIAYVSPLRTLGIIRHDRGRKLFEYVEQRMIFCSWSACGLAVVCHSYLDYVATISVSAGG